MKVKYAMVIDSSKCFNCKACIVSCQLENDVPQRLRRNWIKRATVIGRNNETVFHFQPGNCMHCDRPTCIEVCPTGATFKDEADGVVKVNRELCIGCESCIPACPYGARFRHPKTGTVDKCMYCMRRRSYGKQPACVETCPTGARVFGNMQDTSSEVARLLKSRKTVKVINAVTDTNPMMFYLEETAPLDWTVPARVPIPIWFWREIAGPLVKGFVGLAGFGVAVMLGKQLLIKDDPPGENGQIVTGGRR